VHHLVDENGDEGAIELDGGLHGGSLLGDAV
jgi:hypothetical protein